MLQIPVPRWTLGLPALFFVLTACLSPSEPPDLQDFPTGTYAVTFAEDDEVTPEIVGTWEVVWRIDGDFLIGFDGDPFILGDFSVDGTRVTLTDQDGPGRCPDSGTYEWSFQDPELSFTLVSDDCEGRVEVLTTKPWTRQ